MNAKIYLMSIDTILLLYGSYHFSWTCRLSVAALHFNENSSRQQAVTQAGELQYAISYPKAKKGLEAVVKPKKTPPTFSE